MGHYFLINTDETHSDMRSNNKPSLKLRCILSFISRKLIVMDIFTSDSSYQPNLTTILKCDLSKPNFVVKSDI